MAGQTRTHPKPTGMQPRRRGRLSHASTEMLKVATRAVKIFHHTVNFGFQTESQVSREAVKGKCSRCKMIGRKMMADGGKHLTFHRI